MAEQSFEIQIEDDLKYDIRIENAALASGQFYREGDQSDILTSDDVDDMVIRHNGGRRSICICGDTESVGEAEGSIDLIDDITDARICSLAWRASTQPGKGNQFEKTNQDTRYTVDVGNWSKSGAMGTIPVTIKQT
ncbi:hypothetical protein N7474_009082 [Penicillium riverlandense]|uniref:uncharacterized protein n=1 Tax=Penicillium riverlandense TaxID=1903569 RepID=UPI002546AD51|nr:uncharacterized protein N7474_009082 [Penicillium riverlandense]KAJ5807813.1 hypothetical protein N7474_009082 [Penicillium riverlandense]